MNEQTNERTDGQMDRLTDCWMNDKYDTDIKSVFFKAILQQPTKD